MAAKQKSIVIGAGPVGSLAAIYAAQRGHDVEVYEFRNDLRDPNTTPLNFTKSINLALSERGINAMRRANCPGLTDSVMANAIPMRGRMIHGKRATGELYEVAQDYDAYGRSIYAIDRGNLNKCLLDVLESMPNVKLRFKHKLTGADFANKLAWLEVKDSLPTPEGRPREVQVQFDFLIGADGAHSAARYHLMKFTRMDYHQEYIETMWCEFQIQPQEKDETSVPESRFRISPHHLHIWPGKEFMFIAIPSIDGSFTCTLFLPSGRFDTLSSNPASLPAFFDDYFPGVTSLIPPATLIAAFSSNPHLPLITIKCHPYHFADAAVILGDAAHAMVPFYGQGMNAGLEDVRVLFDILDEHCISTPSSSSSSPPHSLSSPLATPLITRHNYSPHRAVALSHYSHRRAPDAAAINDLALQNYAEMRSAVVSPLYLLRKRFEELLSVHAPRLGWQTKYALVSFGNEPYSDVVRRSESQGRTLAAILAAFLALLVGGLGTLGARAARRWWWR